MNHSNITTAVLLLLSAATAQARDTDNNGFIDSLSNPFGIVVFMGQHRHSRNGPYLGSVLAQAYVHGYQGDGMRADSSLMACVKHYALYGAAEGGRDDNGDMEVCVTNYGGRIVSLMVPDKDGRPRDVVLGHDNIRDYLEIDGNFGAIIGRYGNRID